MKEDAATDLPGFLHDCFQADRQSTTTWNVFGKEVRRRAVATGEERLVWSGSVADFVALPAAAGEGFAKAVAQYAGEEDLVYGSFWIVGTVHTHDNRLRRICSPLFVHPATVRRRDDLWRLELGPGPRVFNAVLLRTLCDSSACYLELNRELGRRPIGADELGRLQTILAKHLPEIDATELVAFPHLATGAQLKPAERKHPGLRLLPGGVAFMAKRSRSTLGTLGELQTLREQAAWSTPLRALLLGEDTDAEREVTPATVPANLSGPQLGILRMAARCPLSMAVGPPGTGKSFTIACVALEHLARGERVLMVSQNDQAVNVVEEKLRELLGPNDAVVRGGRSSYLRDLKRSLEQLLNGLRPLPDPERARRELKDIRRERRRAETRLRKLEAALEKRGAWETKWGRFLHDHWDRDPSALSVRGIQRWYVEHKVERGEPLAAAAAEHRAALAETQELARRAIHLRLGLNLALAVGQRREELITFNRAIRARRLSRQRELFGQISFRGLLRAFPVWLVNAGDLYEVLPMEREMFDVVIIDEASQCDMASCLPALQRARRALIVGDPKQLRHLSFLPADRQRQTARRHRLDEDERELFDYRNRSILDLAGDRITQQNRVCFLDEHYRSAPDIIRFSNGTFYGGALQVMTHRPGADERPAMVLHEIGDERAKQVNGRNAVEAARVAGDLARVVGDHADLPPELCPSLGVCSPFRNQVEWIQSKLGDLLPATAFARHRIAVGTPHRFQGEERDIMFLSFAIDGAAHANTLRFLERPEQFNVAITRARRQQHVYLSRPLESLAPRAMLRRWLEQARAGTDRGPEPDPERAWLLKQVTRALRKRRVPHWRRFELAGIHLDLLAKGRGGFVGIDLVGFPGDTESALAPHRMRQFLRIDIPVVPLSYAEWMFREEDCLRQLDEGLGTVRDDDDDEEDRDDDEEDGDDD